MPADQTVRALFPREGDHDFVAGRVAMIYDRFVGTHLPKARENYLSPRTSIALALQQMSDEILDFAASLEPEAWVDPRPLAANDREMLRALRRGLGSLADELDGYLVES